MSDFTVEQQLAIDKRNTNIIVSAGAGSGKTTVLKERVLCELKEGVSINSFIILTFTKNAANELKERIRDIILKNNDVRDQLDYLDSAYITTFDSYASSLVKKYNYLLNIDKNFSIIDENIVNLETKRILDDIFEEYYEKEDKRFINLIASFCNKDDKDIRQTIINIYKKLVNVIDRNNFLDTYLDTYYSKTYVDNLMSDYENFVFKYRDEILDLFEKLAGETLNEEKNLENNNAINNFRYASSYDELIETVDFKLADARGNIYSEEGKIIKKKIADLKDKLNVYLTDEKKVLINHYLSTYDSASIIIDILKELDKRLTKFKDEHSAYEFHDIAFKAIELVKNHKDVRDEIKYSTYEIMIDEYQDTNDIQDTFISYIENNNVYMVGDIKQSIYRFRNANPYIFKKKYDSYKENLDGFKIDLKENFRSREEVVNSINLIFESIMSDDVGGANYRKEHKMIFGNLKYRLFNFNKSYDMAILSYKVDKDDKRYSKEEIEAFAIANDILSRINSKEKIVYKVNNELLERDIEFKDFVILIDKSKNFEFLKKILEFKGIPTSIKKDISIKEEDEIYILKSIISILIHIRENRFDTQFEHSFLSVARSYVCNYQDDEIFDIFKDKSFKDTTLYKDCLELSLKIDALSNKELLLEIINKFDIVNKTITVSDVEERIAKLEYFINNANDLNDFGMDIYSFNDYFDEILNGRDDVKMSTNLSNSNSVKIMTIHASKGLEYSYVYLPFLASDFTLNSSSSKFEFSTKYGMTIPFNDDGLGNVITHTLYNNDEFIETLSEKIRLFYVALTRAKEKIIMVLEFNESIEVANNEISYLDMLKTKSIRDVLSIIRNKLKKFVTNVNIDDLHISKDYNLVKNYNYWEHIDKCEEIVTTVPLNVETKLLDNKHFSKKISKVVDLETKKKLDFGTFMHYVFEVYDFKNNNIDELDLNDLEKEKLLNFINHDEVKDIKNASIYKEHEIMFTKDGNLFHGFIDLLLEYDDHFDIIDYKLSNLESEEYLIQLNGYKEYIENKYHKKANIYLYSINKDMFKKLN